MRISFCFSGWVRGYAVSIVTDANGNDVAVPPEMSPEEVIAKIKSGEWLVPLTDALNNTSKTDADLFDFEITD